jgi:response regulator RpfG family c-di-GMP phosphodiesterase
MVEARKILIVDDNRLIRGMLEKLLASDGYRIITAGNGKEGYTASMMELPDLIISDVDMPVMDGGEMFAKLKSSILTLTYPSFSYRPHPWNEFRAVWQPSIYLSKMCTLRTILGNPDSACLCLESLRNQREI